MPYSEKDLPPILSELTRSNSRSASEAEEKNLADVAAGIALPKDKAVFFSAIMVSEAVELYSAVRDLKPENSAEIGFCCGGSGIAILKALRDNGRGTHHACDPFQFKADYIQGAGLRNVEASGLTDLLDFHDAYPEVALPNFPRIQFAFIDASHLFDLSILDFLLVDKKLDVGGVIAFHDMWLPSLQKMIRYILGNRQYRFYTPPGIPQFQHRGYWLRKFVGKTLRHFPKANKIFRQELLHPWVDFPIGNIVMLEKVQEDSRDWRHFVDF